MKKHTIIISILFMTGILFLYFTCTYFNAFEAAGIEPPDSQGTPEPSQPNPGDNIFGIDQDGVIYNAQMNNPQDWRVVPLNPPSPAGSPMCITADFSTSKIYWALDINAIDYEIHRANYDGADRELIYSTNQGSITSLAVDSANRMLYFTENTVISKIPVEGGTKEVVYDPGAGSPVSDLTLNIAKSEVYYTNGASELYTVNMFPPPDNWAQESNGGYFMYQFSFDSNTDVIFWADLNGNTIYNAKIGFLNSLGTEISNCGAVFDLVADSEGGFIYWLDMGDEFPAPPHAILKMNSDGSGNREEIVLFPGGYTVYYFTIDFLL